MGKDQTVEQARSNAAKELFFYIYHLRHGRQPVLWEWVVGQAVMTGELQVSRPPKSGQLQLIHEVVNDVSKALRLADLVGETDGE